MLSIYNAKQNYYLSGKMEEGVLQKAKYYEEDFELCRFHRLEASRESMR